MPTIGLVLTLSDKVAECQNALRHLEMDASITVGRRDLNQLPVVVEAPSGTSGKGALRVLSELPGVTWVHVVTADFSADDPMDEMASEPGRC